MIYAVRLKAAVRRPPAASGTTSRRPCLFSAPSRLRLNPTIIAGPCGESRAIGPAEEKPEIRNAGVVQKGPTEGNSQSGRQSALSELEFLIVPVPVPLPVPVFATENLSSLHRQGEGGARPRTAPIPFGHGHGHGHGHDRHTAAVGAGS